MDSGLLNVSGDAGHKGISVLKVGVEVGLWEDGEIMFTKNDTGTDVGYDTGKACVICSEQEVDIRQVTTAKKFDLSFLQLRFPVFPMK